MLCWDTSGPCQGTDMADLETGHVQYAASRQCPGLGSAQRLCVI